MQGVRWRPHLFRMQAVLHRVSRFEEKKMLLCSFKTESPLLKTMAGLKRLTVKLNWFRVADHSADEGTEACLAGRLP